MSSDAPEHIQSLDLHVDGHRTRVYLAGAPDANPILLVHDGAWGADASTAWGRMFSRLSGSYRVIAPDMVGFGNTAKVVVFDKSRYQFRIDHLDKLLQTLCVERPVDAVGTSFGGSLLLHWMALKGDNTTVLRSVTSISGSGGLGRRDEAFAELAHYDGTRDDMSRIVALLMDRSESSFEHIVVTRHELSHLPGHYEAVTAARSPSLPQAHRSSTMAYFPEALRTSPVPVLLIKGNDDKLLRTDWCDGLSEHLQNADVVALPGMHSPNMSNPDAVIETLNTFLSSC